MRSRVPSTVAALTLLTASLAGVNVVGAQPAVLDTDGDGSYDSAEIFLGSDPGDPASTPETFADHATCIDLVDNDLDGLTDGADPGCHPQPAAQGSFPPAGLDVFASDIELEGFDVPTPVGACVLDFHGSGPSVVQRSDPVTGAGGAATVDVELVAMQLSGLAVLAPGTGCNPSPDPISVPMSIFEDPSQPSLGQVIATSTTSDFPADSFFDVFFLIDIAGQRLPVGPLHVVNDNINTLPPFHSPGNAAGNPNCYEFGGVHKHCPKPPLDHFKCYTAKFPKFTQVAVFLFDQFMATPATVTRPRLFCNPVEKDGLPIFDPGAHLKFYRVKSPIADLFAGLPVIVINQFGGQVLEIDRLVELAVPTQKHPHMPPLALDHFMCYRVEGDELALPVSLVDQFHTEDSRVLAPWRLCNPAAKTHDGQVTPALDPFWHLVCYRIVPPGLTPVSISTSNQFGDEELRVRHPRTLCVPSFKFVDTPPPPPPPPPPR